jgi:hypothetical protein
MAEAVIQQEQQESGVSSRVVFGTAIALGAFLLFQVEFILAKFLLPWFGGTTGVWATNMLCFQLALLAGYAYAHWLQRQPRQATIHLAVLGIAALVVCIRWMTGGVLPGPSAKPAPDANPIFGIIRLFVTTIGFPFAVLASTAPLLQAWYARIHRREPYVLYSLSNAGSLLALVTYPLLFERMLRLRVQSTTWTAAFLVYAIFAAACAWRALANRVEAKERVAVSTPLKLVLLWFALAACPSALFLAVTNYLTQDVAPIPLLWAIPLAIYLLSFILVFSNRRWYVRGVWHFLFLITTLLAIGAVFGVPDIPVGEQLAIFSSWLFVVCVICHGELVCLLPEEAGLTKFYLTIAAGGAFGGLFVAIVAPFLFAGVWELHVAAIITAVVMGMALWWHTDSWLYRTQLWLVPFIAAVVLVAPRVLKHFDLHPKPWMLMKAWPVIALVLAILAAWMFFVSLGRREGRHIRLVNESIVALVLLAISVMFTWNARLSFGDTVFRARNFYGALSVEENELNPNTRYFELIHGRIMHGQQLATRASIRYEPTSYYTESSGSGIILRYHPQRKVGPLRVGAVGLGTGTLAGYAKMGDVFRFYEINPVVIGIAQSRPEPWFDYVNHARSVGAQVDIVQGDARLSLERELRDGRPSRYDVLLVDAFNGDSIPIHLLTVEAIQLYLQHLRNEDSVIALHISNRNVDLKRIAAGLAQRLNLYATLITVEADDALHPKSDWVLMSRSPSLLRIPEVRAAGAPLIKNTDFFAPPPPAPVWTDDFSNVWQVLELKDEDPKK